MSIDPTTIPSLIDRCIIIYKYLQDVKESSEERRRLMRGVMVLRDVLRSLQEQLSNAASAQNPSLMAHLAQLFDPSGHFVPLMTNTLRKLEKKLRRGADDNKTGLCATATKVKAAVLWSMDKDEVKTLLAELERYKTLALLAMEQDASSLQREMHRMISEMAGTLSNIAATTTNIKETIDTIGVAINDYDRRKVAKWISKISFSEFHAENSRKWLKGTGSWVLESPAFQEWANRTSSPPVLWCYGDAGAGKSVIAAMIVEHLRSISGNIVLVIVCRYNQYSKYLGETYIFLCCLLRQLIQLGEPSNIPSTLLQSYRNGIYPSEEIPASSDAPIFIVLDALDECPLGFDVVAAIQRLGHDFNLLITSRNVFSQRKQYPSLHIRAADHDVLALVNSKIPKLCYVQEDKELQSAVRSEVGAKANGMFLLASLTLWELEHDVASKSDVRRVLASFPTNLDNTYRQIFERIRDQGARRKNLAFHANMWVYASSTVDRYDKMHWPVLKLLLNCAISTSEPKFQEDCMPSTDDIVNACGGLLGVEYGHDIRLVFMHYSVQEYISRFESSIFNSEDPYALVFETCTTALHHAVDLHIYSLWCLTTIWLTLARFLDSRQPSGPVLVLHALMDKQFTKTAVRFGEKNEEGTAGCYSKILTPWVIDLFLNGDGSLTALDYAAAFGLPRTLQLAQEAQAPDEHQLRRAMAIAVGEGHWDLVNEVWAHGDYDINLCCDRTGSTALCQLVSSSPKITEERRRSLLHHPRASLCCPRHDSLLGCALRSEWEYAPHRTLENIAMILERLSRNATSMPFQPARFSTYPSPGAPSSDPPNILDVIAVFMRREDIDLDAKITQMVPPEILLALLMLPWHLSGSCYWDLCDIEKSAEILRPYARRPVDVSDVSTFNSVPDTDQ